MNCEPEICEFLLNDEFYCYQYTSPELIENVPGVQDTYRGSARYWKKGENNPCPNVVHYTVNKTDITSTQSLIETLIKEKVEETRNGKPNIR